MSKISLGIIGGGQLGSLLCAAAKNININTVVISDDEESPAKYFADHFIPFVLLWSNKDVRFLDRLARTSVANVTIEIHGPVSHQEHKQVATARCDHGANHVVV